MDQEKQLNKKHSSTGRNSTGDFSTGNNSTGDFSTGNFSTGNFSTGWNSTGNFSAGSNSTGSFSTGHHSVGHGSTGSRSSGYRSTGDWSTGDWSTGCFSTEQPGFTVFNKPYSFKKWNRAKKPKFIYFDLTKWVKEKNMTDKEKNDYPDYKATGGYLKVYSYREAWKNAWKSASKNDKKLLYNLPNFNPKVFEKISGIDVTTSKSYKKFLKEQN